MKNMNCGIWAVHSIIVLTDAELQEGIPQLFIRLSLIVLTGALNLTESFSTDSDANFAISGNTLFINHCAGSTLNICSLAKKEILQHIF